MRATEFRVGNTELVRAFVEQELAGLITNSQGAFLEFHPETGYAKAEDDGRSVKHIMVVATVYWESLVAYLRTRSQPMSRDPKSSPNDRQLAVPYYAGCDATVHMMFECCRASNAVKTIRLYYGGTHANPDVRGNRAFA